MIASPLPRYDAARTYRENYDHPPPLPRDAEPSAVVSGEWTFCGRPVGSPLGMPAGPLLNGRWILYYAALGFEVLTYKTVRSVARECYPLPNLQPVATGQLTGDETEVPATAGSTGSWAVSFGMPSADPATWRADVEWTRRNLPAGKLLSVSVVGSVQPAGSLSDLADDYARCAQWAVESGADAVESNFSCPNVSTCDGQLYQQPDDAALVAERIRGAVCKTPYIIKIGSMTDRTAAGELVNAVAPFADALAMTNSVAAKVRQPDGSYLFDGQRRGICGDATRKASLQQSRMFCELIRERGLNIRVIGVGGISTAAHVRQFLDAGAESVHIATAAMLDPSIGLQIRKDFAATNTD